MRTQFARRSLRRHFRLRLLRRMEVLMEMERQAKLDFAKPILMRFAFEYSVGLIKIGNQKK